MARYVVSSRRGRRLSEAAGLASRSALVAALDGLPVALVGDEDSADQLPPRAVIVEAPSADMAAQAIGNPADFIVEPEILHWPVTVPTPDLFPFQSLPNGGATPGPFVAGAPAQTITVVALAEGSPLARADVRLYLRSLGGVQEARGVTGSDGTIAFQLPPGAEAAAAVVAPEHTFWTMVVRGSEITRPVTCPRLPTEGPLGWWHGLAGLDVEDPEAGDGIRVGIVDSGAGPHPCTDHATLVGAFIGGAIFPPSDGADVGQHGTHVAGTIGARPSAPGDYAGLAPGCEIFVARVFSDASSGANNADIANAIEVLSRDHGADLINLSLGTTIPSETVRDAIAAAVERGTLCLCAAGNDGRDVNYPAAFSESVAVTAAGLAGWGPPGSLSGSRLPLSNALFGRQNLFAANFTSSGSVVACIGAGVGILAPVPSRSGTVNPYAAMDGTSMACPAACGTLAVLLSRNAPYRALPRNATRAVAAKRILASACRDIGLPQVYQGRGLPSVNQGIV